MAAIRGKNTKPELVIRRYLHSAGFRFRLHSRKLPGRPDIVLPRHRAVVNVHGCFWHQHEGCLYAYMPASNRDFWSTKLLGNVQRDRRNDAALSQLGWRVFTVWECEIRKEPVLRRLAKLLRSKR